MSGIVFQPHCAGKVCSLSFQAAGCVSYWQPQYLPVDTQQDEAPSVFFGIHAGAQEGEKVFDAFFSPVILGELICLMVRSTRPPLISYLPLDKRPRSSARAGLAA